jgi:hypothetical protein
VVLSGGLVWGAEGPAALGLAYLEQPGAAGTLESRGQSLRSGELLITSSQGALVRLANGQVLRMAPNSSARLEAGAGGDVGVTVLSGRLALVDDAGQPLLAGQRSQFRLPPAVGDPDRAERQLLALDIDGPPSRPEDPR